MLARAFGCARVVYNDALRARSDAWAAGERITDTEVQRRVVTLAKTTPERAWLGEVASVALVQACGDRDLNAARNILVEGRKVAAGLADTGNACGGDVRREAVPAVTVEAGTRRGAA